MHQIRLHAHRTLELAAAAVALVLVTGSGTAMAQDHAFFLSYYANAHTPGAPDGTLRLTNDGHASAGNLWADIYVFNDTEQLEDCCSCEVTPNGYLSLSVDKDLTGDPLSWELFHDRGLIMVVSSATFGPTAPVPKPGIRAWITHPEALAPNGQYSLSVEQLTDSNLGSEEATELAETCSFIYTLGIGDGAGACFCKDAGR
jgi:hypothetical protein